MLVCDLASFEAQERWPTLAPALQAAGFRSVTALPMRLRNQSLGALNLFSSEPGGIPAGDLASAQALADVASIGILQERAVRDARMVIDQLQTALNSRIVIEQAKGVIAQHAGVGVDIAFSRLRQYARNHNLGLSETARRVVDGDLNPAELPI